MHLFVPFASADSEAARSVLGDLALPNLVRLLAATRVESRVEGDAHSLTPPHEHALALARGWTGGDGRWPFAAAEAAADGLATDRSAWALVTPCHWVLGRESAVLADPAVLALDDAAGRALHASLAEGCAAAGIALHYVAPTRWYAQHDDFAQLATASLDRAIGRAVHDWLPSPDDDDGAEDPPRAAAMRRTMARLQAEAQLAWHDHPVNAAREHDDGGLPVVNAFWISGTGRAQPFDRAHDPRVHGDLRGPALAADWVAWADAWRALDAGPLRALVDAPAGEPVALTLCGERHAERRVRERSGPSWWQRLAARRNTPSTAAMLASL